MARATTTPTTTATKTSSRTSTKTTTSKRATPAKTVTQAAADAADVATSKALPKVVTADAIDTTGTMRKRDLINMVAERSGIKKKYTKPVIEAALAVIGEALADGRDLNLPPAGKIKINRTKRITNGRVIITRVRQNDRQPVPPKDPLAEAAE